jgi:hypothetical protein
MIRAAFVDDADTAPKSTAKPAAESAAQPDFYRLRTIAARLDVSLRTISRLSDAQKIPGRVMIAGCIRHDRAKIDAWIAAGCPGATLKSNAAARCGRGSRYGPPA